MYIRHTSFFISLLTTAIFSGLLLLQPGGSSAETRYVSDTMVLNLRDNIKSPFKVVTTVISDEPLIILEERDKFLFVETVKGKKGWIATQYVKSKPPKSEIITQLQSELKLVKGERDNIAEKLKGLRNDIQSGVFDPEIKAAKEEAAQLQQARETLLAEKKSIKQDYDRRFSKLSGELEALQNNIDQQNKRVEELTAQNSRLSKYKNIYWFCAGAAVFISGIIAGKMMSRKKKRYTYSL